jgi:16S rRNA (uracil1498-N3)-methyltransferase
MKQSKRLYLPKIEVFNSLKDLIQTYPQGYIAHCNESNEKVLLSSCKEGKIWLIGPEGDFTTEEVKWALKHGFTEISLGDFRLRTETAALLAVARQI